MHYYASYVPLVREAQAIRRDSDSKRKPVAFKVSDAFDLVSKMAKGMICG